MKSIITENRLLHEAEKRLQSKDKWEPLDYWLLGIAAIAIVFGGLALIVGNWPG